MMSSRNFKWINAGLTYTTLGLLTVFSVFPLVWLMLSSLKTSADLTKHADRLFPRQITFEFFERVLRNTDYIQYMGNSVVVSLCATLISLTVSALGAYALVRFYPNLGKWAVPMLIIAYMFPHILLVIPFFTLISGMGLANTATGLVLAYVSFSVPFSMWLLIGFFRSVPLEIEEAATMDGASKMQTFFLIAVPLAAPGLVAIGIYTFINAWNEFLFSLVLISSGDKKTLSVGLYSLVGGETLQYGDMLAASAMFVIPSLIFFFIVQKHIASGLTSGAVK